MNTAPRYVTCLRCSARVLEARWDYQMDTLIGEPLLDPVALTQLQVVACVITRIPLWQVHEHAGHTVTSHRSRWWPTKPVDGHTVPEHACGRVWDAPRLELAIDPPLIPDACPF